MTTQLLSFLAFNKSELITFAMHSSLNLLVTITRDANKNSWRKSEFRGEKHFQTNFVTTLSEVCARGYEFY